MRILLDECAPKALRKLLTGHETQTVIQMRWGGKRNGELLRLMAAKAFQVLVTTDRHFPRQQNLRELGVALLILRGRTNDINDLTPLVPEALLRLATIAPGDVVEVYPPMPATKLVIGIVGGIGSGKSTAAAALARRGGRVVAGDPAGHEALRQPVIRDRIAKRWPDAVGGDGEIDRRVLGRAVFANPVQLRELEALVFPWIKGQLRDDIAAAKADAEVKFVVLDAAVMLEAGWDGACDRLVFVDAPREVRAARVASRGWTADDLDRRERSQMSLDKKRGRADAVLENSGSPDELQAAADELLAQWGLMPKPTRGDHGRGT